MLGQMVGWFLWCALLGLAVTWSPSVIPEQSIESRILFAALIAGVWGGLTGGVLRAWALHTAKVEMAEAIQNYDRLAAHQNEFRDAAERALAPHGLWLARWGTDKAGTVNVEFRKVTAETAPCQDAPGDDVTGTPPGESDV